MKAIFFVSEEILFSSGISKKILSQCDGLRSNGVEVELCYVKRIGEKSFFVIGEFPVCCLGRNDWVVHMKSRYKYREIADYIIRNDFDFIYVRYIHNGTPFFLRFLELLKKHHVKIFLEIPTWPYDLEFKYSTLSSRILLFIEKWTRKRFKKYVDRIVTVQNYESILNVPTIKISNAVDLSTIPMRKPVSHKGFVFLGVANLGIWHGYDRLIEGIGLYYKNGGKEDIQFYIVGNTDSVLPKYMEVANKYNISKRIHIEGSKAGDELNRYFDMADMAVGSLGGHRKGLVDAKPLKCVEYAARGIPFFYSENNTDFDGCVFVKRVSPDDTPIAINEMLDFSRKLEVLPEEIRLYIHDSLTWHEQMKKIISDGGEVLCS